MVLKYHAVVDPQYGILSTKGQEQPNYSTCNLRMYLENTDSLQIWIIDINLNIFLIY